MPQRETVAGEANSRLWHSKMKFTLLANWMRSPLGIVSSLQAMGAHKARCVCRALLMRRSGTASCARRIAHLLSSSTELSDSIHSGSTSPSHTIQLRCSSGSLTTRRAAAVSTPSLHSRVSRFIEPSSCTRDAGTHAPHRWHRASETHQPSQQAQSQSHNAPAAWPWPWGSCGRRAACSPASRTPSPARPTACSCLRHTHTQHTQNTQTLLPATTTPGSGSADMLGTEVSDFRGSPEPLGPTMMTPMRCSHARCS